MQDTPLYQLPKGAVKAVRVATENGWSMRSTWAEGPPPNVVIRFFREGKPTVYGVWLEARWGWARTQRAKPLNSGQLISYLDGTYDPHAATEPDSGSEPGGVESADARNHAPG